MSPINANTLGVCAALSNGKVFRLLVAVGRSVSKKPDRPLEPKNFNWAARLNIEWKLPKLKSVVQEESRKRLKFQVCRQIVRNRRSALTSDICSGAACYYRGEIARCKVE